MKQKQASSQKAASKGNKSSNKVADKGKKNSNQAANRGDKNNRKVAGKVNERVTVSSENSKAAGHTNSRKVAAKGNMRVQGSNDNSSGAGHKNRKSASAASKARNAKARQRSPQLQEQDLFGKNEAVELEVIGLTHDGDGVGKTADAFTFFVPGALPGEKISAKVLKVKKQYGFAKLMDIRTTSEERVQPPCPIYDECGGCQLQHLNYDAELNWKRQHVIDSLTRIGKLKVIGEGEKTAGELDANASEHEGSWRSEDGILVHPTVGMPNPWRYRNKAAVPIGRSEKTGELIGGFYAKGSHRIIEMDACIIQKEKNDEVVQIVKEIAQELRMVPYDEENGTGVLRHVMVRIGVVTGEVMVVLITNTARLPRQPEWIEHIRKRIPNVKSIVHNVNDRVTNAIFGETTSLVWGKEVIYDELDGIRFAISARSFYQVNPEQTIALYRKAVEYAGLTGTEQVIDAYCGIGTISLFLARNAGHVYGVEIVPEAIEDAKRNAELNELSNTTFEAGPAEVVIPRWKREGMEADVIVVDPPRKGCDPALLETILAIRPERVVYVSCNPSTLARDLRVLEDGGYKTMEVTPVDMFPHTGHVEVVIGMQRKDT